MLRSSKGVPEAPAVAASAPAAPTPAAPAATDADAAGADRDWFAGQSPGIAFLFPEEDHNPRAPTLRVAVKHLPGQSVALTISGRAAEALSFDGTQTSADGTMAVSVWRGLPLVEGDNVIRARVLDAAGAEVETIVRRVRYANTAARAEFLPEQSRLVADGATRPVIAVRITDRAGHPVREGTTGPLHIASPYTAALDLDAQQMQQLSGLASRAPTWRVEGDDGMALIELAPTTQGGEVVLEFPFAQASRQREVRAWLSATREDWIVVGFAASTAGFNTLSQNSVPLDEEEDSDIVQDGQLSFYASGRVLGSWLLTLAYDSERRRDDRGLLSTIDPDRYYTVYGDGTEQSYDAASRQNLYVRLERDQFYALFGDFETGLTQTELSRYSRTLTGARVEYRGNLVTFSGFAAETQDRFVRDELQGSGLSGPYQLSRRDVISGSDKIVLETRDRLRTDRIVARRELSRHIDYDIDYAAGTIRFRQPIASRDRDFNPIFIVAEYEVFGSGEDARTAGGRAAVRLFDGAVELGASVVTDQTDGADAELAGFDATIALGADTTVRVEAASSTMAPGGTTQEGAGFLVEAEHHAETADILAYVRQQDRGFGIGQQSLGLSDARRYGIEGAYDFSPQLSFAGNLYREEQLTGAGARTAGEAQLRYIGEDFALRGGVQAVNDISSDGRNLESRLLTLGASRFVMDRRLEISSDVAIPFGMSAESADFPARYRMGAAYTLTDNVRLIGNYELAQGEAFESQTVQLGFDSTPWTGARLTGGLNQASVPEFGPRTYALFGIAQSLPINERLTIDVALESSATISGEIPEIDRPDSDHPAAAGGYIGADALNEDFTAISLGAAYRADIWSWNGRLESRDGDAADRFGVVTHVLRQLESGIVVGSSLRVFQSMTPEGAETIQAGIDLSIAWRPMHSNWSILNRLEFQYDALTGAEDEADARSRRAINNFALSYDEGDTGRLMGTIYYGSKFVFARFEDQEFEGYVDMFGIEARYDVTEWLDLGLQGGVHHAWDAEQYAFTFGPSIGLSPFTNTWVTLGYNVSGFRDRDLDMSGYTDVGPYLTVRMKFDQDTFESPERVQ
ncbi:MAG: hypothetical protein IPL62_17635 [Caulobacteraceae bacterium]|nr:hypothetical protein [Caulobacteraceae bacterium]